jgi:hypothetical protein
MLPNTREDQSESEAIIARAVARSREWTCPACGAPHTLGAAIRPGMESCDCGYVAPELKALAAREAEREEQARRASRAGPGG